MNAARQSKKSKSGAEKDLESFRDIADDVIESDFVPYACLYDKDSVVTKNGEILHIIKITGLGFDAQHQGDLRTSIRQAIRQCIPDTSYAIWLHTLRRKQPLLPASKFPDQFSGQIDASWRETHPAAASFVNELYITVVKAGQQAGLRNLEGMLQSLWPPRDRGIRTAYLENSMRELATTTANILNVLRPFGARLLTTVERHGVFYGEHLEFLEKLINLENRQMPIPERDLSHVLTSGEITFGFNAMEVRTAEGHRRFATILTVKEYKESTLAGIDKFLDIPCELIVSQCFDFVGGEHARNAYETQARYLEYSGDKELAGWMEIDRLMQDSTPTSKAFGEQQTCIFLIAPTVKQLESNVRLTQKALARLGMAVVREDLRFEDCYWAQLPGNFPFISRKHSVDTQHLAGFANLQAQPQGNAGGSPWGPPISLFTTVQDTPYFFNFHRDKAAHTVLLGKGNNGHTAFAHFLLAQARKIPGLRIWYIDVHGRASSFVRAQGGTVLTPGTRELQLNPFQLEATNANREFLALWLSTLIDPSGHSLNQSTLSFFQSLIDAVLRLPPQQRNFRALLPLAKQADPMLANQFARFAAGGEFGELFDMPADQFAVSQVTCFNIARWFGNAQTRVPLTSYLLHRMVMQLNGAPTLIVLDEGFELLANPFMSANVGPWLDILAGKNAAVMLLTDAIEQSGGLAFAPAIADRAASIFAFPDSDPAAEYSMGLRFSPQEVSALAHADKHAHHVLMKRGDTATMLKVDLTALGPLYPTLRGAAPAPAPEQILEGLMHKRPAGVPA